MRINCFLAFLSSARQIAAVDSEVWWKGWRADSPSDASRTLSSLPAITNKVTQVFKENRLKRVEFRDVSGINNNLQNPAMGAAGSILIRVEPHAYEGTGLTAQSNRMGASPRLISNIVSDGNDINDELETTGIPTNAIWGWGQFLDHDLIFLETVPETLDISVPTGDVYFDPNKSGTEKLPFHRSKSIIENGIREQVNSVTAWLDGSAIYGSNKKRATTLRGNDGKLLVGSDGLMMRNTPGLPNIGLAGLSTDPNLFLAGDVRANEVASLTSFHTLFVLEHNRWVDILKLSGQFTVGNLDLYEIAKAIVTAEIQAITYNEFLPLLLGTEFRLDSYQGYDPTVSVGTLNAFASAAFRFGHSLVPSVQVVDVSDEMGGTTPRLIRLRDSFFNNPMFTDLAFAGGVLSGLCNGSPQKLDHIVTKDLRSYLFGKPGAGGLDLVALNIQRGRDHGLPPFNTVRQAFGLPAVKSFDDMAITPDAASRLRRVYAGPDDCDMWMCGMAERHTENGGLGVTFAAILQEQFTRLRDGDRFWYENYLSQDMVALVNRRTLSVIMKDCLGVDLGRKLALQKAKSNLKYDRLLVPSRTTLRGNL